MTFARTLFVVTLVLVPLGSAHAQFGGMPGMPGSPGMSPGFGAAPQQPPPACQNLLTLRDQVQKHGTALQNAGSGKKKPSADEACKLFKVFLSAESKFIKGMEDARGPCGIPAEAITQIKSQHSKTSQVGKNVCDAAARGSQPAGPSFSEALGTTPLGSEEPDRLKRGPGTFDTLTGNNPIGR
jgi:hypothetical protein